VQEIILVEITRICVQSTNRRLPGQSEREREREREKANVTMVAATIVARETDEKTELNESGSFRC
jgi:hypothetical protein